MQQEKNDVLCTRESQYSYEQNLNRKLAGQKELRFKVLKEEEKLYQPGTLSGKNILQKWRRIKDFSR